MANNKKLTRPLLIWFYGRHDSGKTTTMKKVADLLRTGCVKFVEHRSGSDSMFVCQYGNYRIGINTRGDGTKDVAEGLERFLRLNLDVCIASARPRFQKWQNKVTSRLSQSLQNKFNRIDVMEIPRWIVGSSRQAQSYGCAILSISAEDLFYVLVRLMKSGLPKKWPESKTCSCLSDFYWNLTEKGAW